MKELQQNERILPPHPYSGPIVDLYVFVEHPVTQIQAIMS